MEPSLLKANSQPYWSYRFGEVISLPSIDERKITKFRVQVEKYLIQENLETKGTENREQHYIALSKLTQGWIHMTYFMINIGSRIKAMQQKNQPQIQVLT